ncbi:MAG TPA: hypothetical protein VGL94_18215 [Ktedonobacteraceae bacterium]|jgi:hypothetical protein
MSTRKRQLTAFVDGDLYYAAQKTQEVLGMTYSAVRNQVIAGNITAKTPKGKRQLYYRAKDVEELARELNVFTTHRKNKPTQFERLKTKEEMEQCQEISQALFGVQREITDLMKTVEKNPETYYILKDENQIIGYTAIWPVKTEKLNNILAQTLPVQVSLEDIEVFESGKSIDIYIVVIGVKPNFTRAEGHYYGARLISGLIGVIVNLGERGIPIGTIAARSNMPDGIRLMKGIGFTEIEPLTPERRTFTINIKESGIPFVMKYKEKIRKWQEEHNNTKILEV